MVYAEIRKTFGYMRKLEEIDAYYEKLMERQMSPKQMQTVAMIYHQRRFEIEHPDLPRRCKR